MSATGKELEALIKDLVRQVLTHPDPELKDALISGLGIVKMVSANFRDKLEQEVEYYKAEATAIRDMLEIERKNSKEVLDKAMALIKRMKEENIQDIEKLKLVLKCMPDRRLEKEEYCIHAQSCPFIIEKIKVGGQCKRKDCLNREREG